MEIKSNITQIPTTHHYAREYCVVHFSNYKCTQQKFTCKVFTVCIYLCDVGDNFSKTKNSTI